MKNESFAAFTRQPSEQVSSALSDSGMRRERTGTSVSGESFAGLEPEEARRARALRDKLSEPLLVPRAKDDSKHHEAAANPFSFLLLWFMRHSQNTAEKVDADLDVTHLDPVLTRDSCDTTHKRFIAAWDAEMERVRASGDSERRPNVLLVLLRMELAAVLLLVVAGLISAAMPFSTPIMLKYIDEYMNDPNAPQWHGGLFAAIMFVCRLIQTFAAGQTDRITVHLQLRFEGALRMFMAEHAIGITADGLASVGGVGATFQVFSNDVMQVSQMSQLLQAVPLILQVIGAFVYLFVIVGWPAVGALAIFFVVLPFNYRISNSFIDAYIAKMMAGDERTKKIVEIINNIKAIKFYSWENPFVQLVADLREPELVQTSQLMKLIAFIMCSFSVAPPLMQLGVYVLLIADNPDQLTVVKFFQSLSLIQILAGALMQLPWSYSSYLQMKVGGQRLTKIFVADSRELPQRDEVEGGGTVQMKDATFVWSSEEAEKFAQQSEAPASQEMAEKPANNEPLGDDAEAASPKKEGDAEAKAAGSRLRVPELEVNAGELVMVVGKLGGGKSALVNSILGELICVAGKNEQHGRVAYTPQAAWVINATIRNNIIMQNDYDEARYEKVVRAVDLHVDFRTLPNGDLTEIGEKGINLSGGQKQRVSLARALYTEADVYLFDDPLSALDAHVGRHVFEEGVNKLLAGKTRVLVTHALGFLTAANRVYVADNMTVRRVEKLLGPGDMPPEPANADDESAFVQLMRAWYGTKGGKADEEEAAEEREEEEDDEDGPYGLKNESIASSRKKKKKKKMSGALTVQEERQSGQVSSATLLIYLKSFGGPVFWTLIMSLHVISVGAIIFANLWLGLWAGGELPDSIQYKYKPEFYIGIYAGVVFVTAFIVLGRELIWRTGAVNAPRVLYKAMSDSVLRTSMSFFDTTPVGRIINRFTKDSEQLDFDLPMATNLVFIMTLEQIGGLVAMCYLMPWFTPVAVLLLVTLYHLQPTVATVVLRRLSSSLAGPNVALFSETVMGASSIRAASLGKFFLERFSQTVDNANAAQYADQMLFSMVTVNVGIVTSFLVGAMFLIVMLTKDDLTPATSSFVITQGMGLTLGLGFLMMQRGQLAMSLNSIERLTEYSRLPHEAEGSETPSADWPEAGEVELQNVTAQYREGQPLVLKDVSIVIKGGEKVGVCGRTGSGKSTLLLTLFRLIPLIRESRLLIDGVDTATIPLDALRSKLSAIPQEPVLFSGSVRTNIDPFKRIADEAMMKALEQCHLKDVIKAKAEEAGKENMLDLELTESSLSIGEKQLLCLARALARNQRILVLDEATSSVDPHTDKLIQETIRSAFAHCTVITVAHRLNTIMDSDRVLVLDAGRVAEFDSPTRLKADPHTIFAQLVADAEREEEG